MSCVIFWGCYGKILKYIDIEEEREVSCVCAYIGVCVHSIYIIFYKYIYYYYRDKTLPFNDLGVLRELIITVTGEL